MTVTIKHQEAIRKPAEIYQSGTQLSLVNANYEQLVGFALCKDFFNEIVWGGLLKESVSKYGYTYDGVTPPFSPDKARVITRNPSFDDFEQKQKNVIDLVNQLEDELGWDHTILEMIENPSNSKAEAYYEGPANWLYATPLLGLWTLLIRSGINHTVGAPWRETLDGIIKGSIKPGQAHDARFIEFSMNFINQLVEKKNVKLIFGDDMMLNYPPNLKADGQLSTLHHHSGPVSFCDKMSRDRLVKLFPHWTFPPAVQAPAVSHS